MEPLTVITVLAAKYGITQLVDALTGQQDLGDLAGEFVGALSASESRIGERLSAIESRLDEVLEQRYATAIGTGLRTLLDAGTTTKKSVRQDELLRARDLFREAVASARTTLQVAVAERYLLLCAIALGRTDAAKNALSRLNGAATEAMLESTIAYAHSHQSAQQRVEQSGWPGGQRKRAAQVTEQAGTIMGAAIEAADLASHLLREAGVLAEGLGHSAPPELVKERGPAAPGLAEDWKAIGGWLARPKITGPTRLGAFVVTWNSIKVTAPAPAQTPAQRLEEFFKPRAPGSQLPNPRFVNPQYRNPQLRNLRPVNPNTPVHASQRFLSHLGRTAAPTSTVEVDVTVQADPVLAQPASVLLELAGGSTPIGPRSPMLFVPNHRFVAGQREIRVQRTFSATGTEAELRARCRVIVGSVLAFQAKLAA